MKHARVVVFIFPQFLYTTISTLTARRPVKVKNTKVEKINVKTRVLL